ncbi:helix-turn-helix domain-containing protein [Paraburkholderia sp. BL10I2N1]|uniref:winged helix-turn-helix transcriptional regulator n=1 Tax=Paraburkholderia sp. BL10I2N1 TaxID=1938796 RepID=UPI002442B841|nr:helix-turn-helix domain-containing protein [Paraburkholderia sp. BL10I2N1]
MHLRGRSVLQIQTEATPQMAATRLKSLEADGMIERHPYSEKPLRREYRLTGKGRSFYPVIHALRAWGETWCKDKTVRRLVRAMPDRSSSTDQFRANSPFDSASVVSRKRA